MVHLVSYELKGYRSPAAYHRVAEEIRSLSGVWCHIAESKWLIETELSTQAVSERIAPLTIVGDVIFVSRIYRDWSSYGLDANQIAWLNARNYFSIWEILRNLVPVPKPLNVVVQSAPVALGSLLGLSRNP